MWEERRVKIIDSDTDTDHGTQALLLTQDCKYKYKDRALLCQTSPTKALFPGKAFCHLMALSERKRQEKRRKMKEGETRRDLF